MKTARRLILALLFCIALLTGVHSAAYADTLPPVYSETNVSGTWGDLTWTLDDEGTLTISGSGSMDDFGSRSDEAWLSNRSAVKAVVIEPGVTSIGDYAFYNCSELTSVAIPSSATRIGSSAFYNCSGLNAVYTDDLAAWCQIVFSGSSANPISYAHSLYLNNGLITDLIIPDSVTSIGDYAFYGCGGLTSVTIPSSVTSIGIQAFDYCGGLNAVYIDDLTAWCQIDFASFASSPITYAHNLFVKNALVTDLIIPDGVTSIGDCAFCACSCLKSVTIPESVTSIGSSAFSGCSGLTSVTIPEGVTSIGEDAFDSCSSLTSVTIMGSVTSIDYGTFAYCSSLTSVTLPASVTSIRQMNIRADLFVSGAFDGCSSLTSVTTPVWGKFNSCPVTHVTIPDGTTNIVDQAFNSCNALTSVTIPNSVTSIGEDAFNSCIALTSVTIPASVSSIGKNAFLNCRGLTSVTIPEGVTSIDYMTFAHCSSLTDVTIPASVTSIGEAAFLFCSGLKYVYYGGTPEQWRSIFNDDSNVALTNATIVYTLPAPDFILPAALTRIDEEAFAGGAFSYVKLPDNAVAIASRAFADCPELKYIYIPAATQTIAADAFAGVDGLTILGVSSSPAETFAGDHGYLFAAMS